MANKKISRRTVLKGLGSVVIALPFMEEMFSSAALAAEGEVPMRAFTVFFGLGIPTPLQDEGYNGVLEPLKELSDKLLVMRGVDHVRVDESGSNAHYDGSAGCFTATPPNGTARSGGPSIDQVIRKACYPDGLPAGMIPTMSAGTFFRRSRRSRYSHTWNEDGTAAAATQETPKELFERIFGTIPNPEDQPEARKKRIQRSVLDSVVDQYQFYTSDNSPLGAASKTRLSEHLDRVREYEQRVYSDDDEPQCPQPQVPPDSQIPHGGSADPSGQGIDITLAELTSEWRLMAELYAMAIKCDRVRFGGLNFLAAGERIRLTGRYEYQGRHMYDFDDAAELGSSGDKGCSHEWWHKFRENNDNEQLRAHAHMKMREVAYFLKLLNGNDAVEANGKTILDNSIFAISTESGDGRHNDVGRELSGVFHAISGAGGLFKTNEILNVNAEGLDVYNTMLEAMGVQQRMGPSGRSINRVGAIRT
jgi:hypothetical protein